MTFTGTSVPAAVESRAQLGVPMFHMAEHALNASGKTADCGPRFDGAINGRLVLCALYDATSSARGSKDP
jgi:hypothetical protein